MEEREIAGLKVEVSQEDMIDLLERGIGSIARIIDAYRRNNIIVSKELTLRYLRYITAYTILKETINDPPDDAA